MAKKLTKAEIAHFASNVTAEQRLFCATHLNWREFPEFWLSQASKEPGENLLKSTPFTAEQWQEILLDHVVDGMPELTGCRAQ
jgi:hypothetical protein